MILLTSSVQCLNTNTETPLCVKWKKTYRRGLSSCSVPLTSIAISKLRKPSLKAQPSCSTEQYWFMSNITIKLLQYFPGVCTSFSVKIEDFRYVTTFWFFHLHYLTVLLQSAILFCPARFNQCSRKMRRTKLEVTNYFWPTLCQNLSKISETFGFLVSQLIRLYYFPNKII